MIQVSYGELMITKDKHNGKIKAIVPSLSTPLAQTHMRSTPHVHEDKWDKRDQAQPSSRLQL